MADGAVICRRLDQLRTLRQPHENVWRECFDYSFTVRSHGFMGQQIANAQDAQDKRGKLLDSVSTDAGHTLASSLVSGLTPANARWFGLNVPQASDADQDWLDEAADDLHALIHGSNFDSAALECALDMVGAGWFAMFIPEDEESIFRFEQWPLAQVFAASSKAGGKVDTVYRCYPLSAEQALAEFGSKLSEPAQRRAKDKPDDPIQFVHAIYPRKGAQGQLGRSLPFASCHVELETKHVVREGGFHELPVIVPRWVLIPASSYGVGPMFDALPDVKTLNELKLGQLQAIALALLPPMKATDDGVLVPGGIKRLQSGRIYTVNDIENLQPILTGSKLEVSFTSEERLQASIRRTLMADQLQPQDGPAMTATEVHARVNLIRQLLGPRYGRMQAEYLSPTVERVFGVAYRRGVLGEAPPSILNADYQVKFISPLARAQKMEDVGAIERLNANVGQIAMVQPNVLDMIDTDEQIKRLGDALGVPTGIVRDRDKVIDIRKAKAKLQEAAAAQAKADQAQALEQQAMAKRMEKAV